MLKIIEKGMFSTVQDLGRYGYRKFGVPISGVMDTYSASAGNMLVDNAPKDPVIEITLGGFSCSFTVDTTIAITGGNMDVLVNDTPAPMWQTLHVKAGDVAAIKFGSGFRAYMAVHGLTYNTILASTSTLYRAGFNAPLESGDLLGIGGSEGKSTKFVSTDYRPNYDNIIHIIEGPHGDWFRDDALQGLVNGKYKIEGKSDRMGIRLLGDIIATSDKSLLSCPLNIGAVQVPPSGQPIIIMADGQVTGGYPIIGSVISTDLKKLAQLKPGDSIVFRHIAYRDAVERLRQEQLKLEYIKDLPFVNTQVTNYNIKIKNRTYNVICNEIEE